MEEKLICPKARCNGAPMDKVAEQLPGGDILIDRCPSCGGVYLDGPRRPDGPDELTALLAHVGSMAEFRPRRDVAEDYFAGRPGTPYQHHAPQPQSDHYRYGSDHSRPGSSSHGHASHGHGGHPSKKKGGLLKTLFETLGEG